MDRPGPSSRPPQGTPPPSTSRESPLPQRLTGMRPAATVAEWQLQAVLFRARLVQYYDVFISQGGDDIDQIMQCDEQEFLEIMSLVGMASKPLHVRRLQRTLVEFSRDRFAFLQTAIAQVGPPPSGPRFGPTPTAEPGGEVLRFLVPSYPLTQQTSAFRPLVANQPEIAAPALSVGPRPLAAGTSVEPPRLWTSTASASTAVELLSLVSAVVSVPSSVQNVMLSPVASTSTASAATAAVGGLSDEDVLRLTTFAVQLLNTEPTVEPRTSRRKPNRELVEALALPEDHPQRIGRFRQLAAIYGRPGGRRPQKTLTSHEIAVNEAAAQICLQKPTYLTRRDELFALARRVVRSAGFPRTIRSEEQTEWQTSRSTSPQSLTTPPPSKRGRRDSDDKPPPSTPPSSTS